MVIDQTGNGETVFELFARRARARSAKSLAEQAIACTVGAVLLLVALTSWWPASAALGAMATYAGWGLLDRWPRSRLTRPALWTLATLTLVLALTGVVGTGLAAFTGDGRSPYGMCYDANGRAFACNARGERR